MWEQSNIRITHMIIGNTSIASIPDVIFWKQVIVIEIPFGPICGCSFRIAKIIGQVEPIILIDNFPVSLIEFLCCNGLWTSIGRKSTLSPHHIKHQDWCRATPGAIPNPHRTRFPVDSAACVRWPGWGKRRIRKKSNARENQLIYGKIFRSITKRGLMCTVVMLRD